MYSFKGRYSELCFKDSQGRTPYFIEIDRRESRAGEAVVSFSHELVKMSNLLFEK